MKVNQELISQLESLTKSGDAQQVSAIIDNLVIKKIPRDLASQIAQICFRNSLYLKSLRILNPIIFPLKPIKPEPQSNELIAYATTLISLSMHKEARVLLKKVDKNLNPEALLIESFSYFGEWNYKKTIPLLKQFSSNSRISYYRQIVGKVNLAAAFVASSMLIEAEELLTELLEIARKNNFHLLNGNILELLAQLEVQNKNYAKALSYLSEAKLVFSDKSSLYFFFIKKWESICLMLLNPKSEILIKNCENLKKEAIKWRQWETIRDLDLYISFATKNISLLDKVILGTPNKFYIKKVELLFERKVKPSKTFCFSQNNISESNLVYLNYNDLFEKIKTNKYQSLLFRILTNDFYKPANLGLIFSQLHPTENFNPLSSEKRVLNQFYELKNILNKTGDFFEFYKDKMDFIFRPKPGVKLVFSTHGHRKHSVTTLKEKLRSFGASYFSSSQLAKFLMCSQRKAQIEINKLIKENFITRCNFGPRTVYRLTMYIKPNSQIRHKA